jgi:hypothetical protein
MTEMQNLLSSLDSQKAQIATIPTTIPSSCSVQETKKAGAHDVVACHIYSTTRCEGETTAIESG